MIGWDPRGTGRSEGVVDCIDDADYDRYFSAPDITPDDDTERTELIDLAEEYTKACIDRVDTLQYVGTNNSARDMDAIRQALGAEQVSYFGFSYGSELGGVWSTLFPTTVRAAVFDGATDPDSDPLQSTLQQGAGFEASLATFLAQCSADSQCPFHNGGDAEGAFDRLMASLDESPLPSAGDRVPVNLSVAVLAVAQAMYTESYWPALERALEDAAAGDGAGLLQLHDAYYGRRADGSYGNLIEAFQAINCADDEERPTVEDADADVDEVLAVAPRIFPYTTGSYSCTFFPPALDPRSRSPVPVRVRSWWSVPPATRRRRSTAHERWPTRRRRPPCDRRGQRTHRLSRPRLRPRHRPRVPADAGRTRRRHDLLVAGLCVRR